MFPILTLPDLSATLPGWIADTRILLPFCVKLIPIGFVSTVTKGLQVGGGSFALAPSEGFSNLAAFLHNFEEIPRTSQRAFRQIIFSFVPGSKNVRRPRGFVRIHSTICVFFSSSFILNQVVAAYVAADRILLLAEPSAYMHLHFVDSFQIVVHVLVRRCVRIKDSQARMASWSLW